MTLREHGIRELAHSGQTDRKADTMDFIERIFGVSPDAGTGTTEAALLIGLAMVVFYFVKRRQSAFTWGRRIDR